MALILVLLSVESNAQVISPAGSLICSGGVKLLTLSGANGDTTQWERSTDNVIWNSINGATNSQSYTTAATTAPWYYRAQITTIGVIHSTNTVLVGIAYTPVITFSNYGITSLTVNWTPVGGGSYHLSYTGAASGNQSNVTPPVTLTGLLSYTPITVTVTLTNPAACGGVANGVSTFTPVCPITLSETHINTTCGNNNGSVDLSVLTGTPQAYIWNTGETNEDIGNLFGGNYSVTVTEANGCTVGLSTTIINSNGPSVTETHINSTCAGGNGSINVDITGGTAPYTYFWNNGATDEDLVNLNGDTYSLTVTDQNSCDGFSTVFVADSSFFYYVYLIPTPSNCSNNDGALTANVYNGNTPYSYLWSDGQTAQTANGLGAGFYSVTVTDDIGCLYSVNNYPLYSSCHNVIEGKIYNDANGNCIYDAGDAPMNNIHIYADNGTQIFYGTSNLDGNYSIDIPISGSFQLTVNTWANGNCDSVAVCSSLQITFPSVGDTLYENNFGIISSGLHDLNINVFWTNPNPGFNHLFYILPFNSSFVPFLGSAVVTLYYDASVSYVSSANPQPIHDSVNHTLTWTLNSLPYPYSDWYGMNLKNLFHIPSSIPIGSTIEYDVSITPTAGDCDSSNNYQYQNNILIGSLDPNEKTVTPTGNITADDSVLTYTIHFQNTGTDTTHFVIVKDTLSQYLDPATVVNLASSAPYSEFNISGTGILEWVFNPLFLPDSASNNAASKGFVMFKIKTKHNLPVGSIIQNKASIYFDYNSPVVTNTVSNSIISGIKEIADDGSVTVFPNPFSNEFAISSLQLAGSTITVTDVLGRELLHTKAIAQSASINLKTFSSGVYFITIRNENRNEVRRVVKE